MPHENLSGCEEFSPPRRLPGQKSSASVGKSGPRVPIRAETTGECEDLRAPRLDSAEYIGECEEIRAPSPDQTACDSRNASVNPATMNNPTNRPACSVASGTIVSPSIVMIAPAAKHWTKATADADADPRTAYPAIADIAETTHTVAQSETI